MALKLAPGVVVASMAAIYPDRSTFYRDLEACRRADSPQATRDFADSLIRRQARIELQYACKVGSTPADDRDFWLKRCEEQLWREATTLGLIFTEFTHFQVKFETKRTTTMKLENFNRAKALVSDREYLMTLARNMNLHSRRRMVFGDHDIRPDIVEKLLPDMKQVVDQQIAVVDQKLAEIGVTVE
jgi:ribosomal protein L17